MSSKKYQLLLFLVVFVAFLPFLVKPELLTAKDNDFGRTYIPIFSYFRQSILHNHQIPLWRTTQMMGESQVGNPLAPLFYPPNIIFIFSPVQIASVIFLFIHLLIAAFGTFFLSKSFGFAPKSAFSASIFYVFSTKMLLHLTAGHLTMVSAFSYFPFIFLSARKLLLKPSFSYLLLGSVSLALTYITYPTVYYYSSLFIVFYFLYQTLKARKTSVFIKLKYLILMITISLALSAVALIPQLEFGPFSTRSSMKLEDVALPLWNIKRFTSSLFFPYFNFSDLDHESFLYLGAIPMILAVFGFFLLQRIQKITLLIFGTIGLLFSAGLSTPLFEFAYKYFPLLKYSRITTRFWFIVALIVALLAAKALDKSKRKLVFLLIPLFVLETFYIGYKKLSQTPNLSFDSEGLYQYISRDKNIFRVYCTSSCFNPQLLSKYNLETLNGETPIQDKNFVEFLSQAGNYTFDKFAVIFPPYQVWQTENPPQPNPQLLGIANVKYVASTYPLKDPNFIYLSRFEEILLYQNNKFQNRAVFEETADSIEVSYLPNTITLKFNASPYQRTLVYSENFYPGWTAYTPGNRFPVQLKDPVFRKISIPQGEREAVLKFNPQSFLAGRIITFGTIVLISMYIIRKKLRK